MFMIQIIVEFYSTMLRRRVLQKISDHLKRVLALWIIDHDVHVRSVLCQNYIYYYIYLSL